ncbi:unnamed protein product (macronuclear) [Paramecium tetraurelia]|uniref:Protein kinase domain-containing protein n=1 Tax=Paramecium tetraurelia TaxID=5888 RepID=A0D2P7_PARTE|nr:uncharacterized protein GSPATT00012822001 [Paramecium tetraurelia]CAK77314.1 unnamed protein product [Paramecium tetraurelia]|eukprot:XP_001444711.1 hypothetical protein (macronuclear) [Paramecium tetraurelia strain d4-2]
MDRFTIMIQSSNRFFGYHNQGSLFNPRMSKTLHTTYKLIEMAHTYFTMISYMQFYKLTQEIEQDDINLLFSTCNMFKNSLVFNNNLAFFMDITTGNLKKLNQFDVQQILKKPKLYQQGVLINVQQQYISHLEYEFSQFYNSRVYINFLLQQIRSNQTFKSHSNTTQIWKTQNGIYVKWNNKTFDLYLDNEVFQVFAYDNLDGLQSLPIYRDQIESKSLAIISISNSNFQCEQDGQCLQTDFKPTTALGIYKETELKQCLNEFYYAKASKLPMVYQQNTPQTIEQCFEIHNDDGSFAMILLTIIVIGSALLTRFKFKKQKQNFQINVKESNIELKYIQQNQIQFNELEIIGQGSNGTNIHEGFFQNKTVAVKDINLLNISQSMLSGELEKSFAQQMSLTSEKFIKLYFYEKRNNHLYLAMEKGLINLKDFVKYDSCNKLNDSLKIKIKQNLLDPNFYKSFIHNLLIGLQELEEKQIKHHGLDQENIIFNQDLQVYFADLGMSQRADYYRSKTKSTNSHFFHSYNLKQQLGAIFYYLLSRGDDLKNLSQINLKAILNKFKKYNIKELDIRDLTLKLLFDGPIIDYDNLLSHPYFWTKERKLKFICEFSDYIETFPQKPGQITLQEICIQNQVFKDNWGNKCEILLKEQIRGYDKTQALQLIRLIRNTKNHYHQLTKNSKQLLGNSDRDLFDYWNKNFPNLFFTLYQYSCENNFNLLSIKQN